MDKDFLRKQIASYLQGFEERLDVAEKGLIGSLIVCPDMIHYSSNSLPFYRCVNIINSELYDALQYLSEHPTDDFYENTSMALRDILRQWGMYETVVDLEDIVICLEVCKDSRVENWVSLILQLEAERREVNFC